MLEDLVVLGDHLSSHSELSILNPWTHTHLHTHTHTLLHTHTHLHMHTMFMSLSLVDNVYDVL